MWINLNSDLKKYFVNQFQTEAIQTELGKTDAEISKENKIREQLKNIIE